jgi:Fe-S oxidoreductase
VDPYRPDQNLRLGTDYHPWNPPTHFQFPDDHGSFARSTLRCVGVGKCRRLDGGTMCPSFMVTREEKHSTRGRARLLFEMLQQDVIGTHGWQADHVKDALDLCLACKGCKGDCPVNVDMATYKSEFLSHYYEGRWRPRSAYAFGLVFYWARAGALMPNVANILTQTPGLRAVMKMVGGIAPERQMPAFAPKTFKQWFRERGVHNQGGPQVILWPDTFNNHFFPEVSKAAVGVLEASGYQVIVPEQSLCCGRPLYDFGMLDTAERWLRQLLASLRPQIRSDMPLIGLEPSCVAVFRDELLNLFPHDEDAKRLSQRTFLLSEFLAQAEHFQPPPLHRKAIVHGHCHQKALMGMEAERKVLSKLGLDFGILDSGCCGMAGSFGFEKAHYDVSIQVGEHELLPAVREAADDTLIIADRFSCRAQIAQTTERRALHLAQVIDMAMYQQRITPAHQYAEAAYLERTDHVPSRPALTRAACIGAGAVLAGGLLAWALQKRRAM